MKCLFTILFLFISNFAFSDTILVKPMLEKKVIVPNGGIYRLWRNQTFQTDNICKYIKVFEESPYQTVSGLTYARFEWKDLEKDKNVYLFDKVITPLLLDAYIKRCRTTIGLAILCGTTSSRTKIEGRYAAIPLYLFDELQKSNYPCRADNLYGDSWSPDYDSPILAERYSQLLKAFSKWLEEPFNDTNLKRRDLLFAIEMRYLGYWGEGAIQNYLFPKTSLIDKYLDFYKDYFPTILLIAGGHETLHLPNRIQYENNKEKYQVQINHVSKLFRLRNKKGHVGFFIDSWQYESDQYDKNSNRIILNEKNEIVPLYNYLKDNIYGKRYITGEFDFFGRNEQKPYGLIIEQFRNRHISGLTTNYLRAAHNGKRLESLTPDVFDRVSQAISEIGYRFVLSLVQLKRGIFGRTVSIKIKNIGVSDMYADYYRLHFIVKDSKGKEIADYCSKFNLRSIVHNNESPSTRKDVGVIIKQKIGNVHGKLYLKIIDIKGIEYPLTLSNSGREKDGCYYLCEI